MITKEQLDSAVKLYNKIEQRAAIEGIPVERLLTVIQLQQGIESLDYIGNQVKEVDRTLVQMSPA